MIKPPLIKPQQPQQPIVIAPPKQTIITSNQNAEYIDLEDLPKMNKMDVSFKNSTLMNATITTTPSTTVEIKGETDNADDDPSKTKPPKSTLEKLASKISGSALSDSLTLPIPSENDDMKPLELTTTDEHRNGQPQNTGTPSSVPAFVPKISPPINDKKERDESWKKYLTRLAELYKYITSCFLSFSCCFFDWILVVCSLQCRHTITMIFWWK